MLYGLLVALFVLVCLIMILLVLIQKGKSGMGLGAMGGGTQMLFGGTGGQDFFQKITWVLATLFMGGCLGLGLMKSHYLHDIRFVNIETQPVAQPMTPVSQSTPATQTQPTATPAVPAQAGQSSAPVTPPAEQKKQV